MTQLRNMQVPQAHATFGCGTNVNTFEATDEESICGDSHAEENMSIDEADPQGNKNDSTG